METNNRIRRPHGSPKNSCSKCGGPLGDRHGKQRYCKSCHAEWCRKGRVRHSELSPEQRKKANARAYLNVYLRRGYLQKNPCVKCGDVKVQAHHEDYSKPLEVVWMCRKCHLEYHKQNDGNA